MASLQIAKLNKNYKKLKRKKKKAGKRTKFSASTMLAKERKGQKKFSQKQRKLFMRNQAKDRSQSLKMKLRPQSAKAAVGSDKLFFVNAQTPKTKVKQQKQIIIMPNLRSF